MKEIITFITYLPYVKSINIIQIYANETNLEVREQNRV